MIRKPSPPRFYLAPRTRFPKRREALQPGELRSKEAGFFVIPSRRKRTVHLGLGNFKKAQSAWKEDFLFMLQRNHRCFVGSNRQKPLRANRRLNWIERVMKRLMRKIAPHSVKTTPSFGQRTAAELPTFCASPE